MLWVVPLLLWAALWAWLLWDCLHRRDFAASFGAARVSRWVWGVSFVLLAPLQTLLYLLLVKMPGRRAAPRRGLGMVAAAGLALIVALRLDWIGGAPTGPLHARRADDGTVTIDGDRQPLSAQLAAWTTRTGSEVTTVKDGGGPLLLGPIVVRAARADPVLAVLGRNLAIDLAHEPFATTVSFEPWGTPLDRGGEPVGFVVLLDRTVDEDIALPLWEELQMTVRVRAGFAPWAPDALQRDTRVDRSMPGVQASFTVSLSRCGWVLGAARVTMPADVLRDTLHRAIAEPLNEVCAADGTVQHVPAELIGSEHPLPSWPCLDRLGARLVLDEPALFLHRRAVWEIDADAAAADVEATVKRQLQQRGFEGSAGGGVLTMRKGDVHVGLAHPAVLESTGPTGLWPLDAATVDAAVAASADHDTGEADEAAAPPPPTPPWILEYEDRLGDAELAALAARALADAEHPRLALLFGSCCTGDLEDRFFERLASIPVRSAEQALAYGRRALSAGHDELAERLAREALAWSRVFDGSQAAKVAAFAKQQGWTLPVASDEPIESAALRAAGVIEVPAKGEASADIEADGTAYFFADSADDSVVGVAVGVRSATGDRYEVRCSTHAIGGSSSWTRTVSEGDWVGVPMRGGVAAEMALHRRPDGRVRVTLRRR